MGDDEPSWQPKKFEHVMIDIESMSLSKHNALILSVGLIEFDPTDTINGLQLGTRMVIVPSIEEQLLMGREVSSGTQDFWRKQPSEASEHWTKYTGEKISVTDACNLIRSFCKGYSRVWANGTQFDLSNLEELNRQSGGKEDLWHYQAPRDMRTFCRETPATRLVPVGDALDIPGVAHEPIYDCIVQAWQVWAHWQS